ncbi:mediator of DNA damage checkpoint protein 1-like [Oncorhynchus tshawytscha]|uniref:mediator of DNA damage checkpoint protein 1-like n=1 Tax=Oncorhynchus tshawytscha TaxID=74940 RepID=UPI001C3D2D12|nr:mediator of DNA damage checkpoint protein 1-like [Oncorhynchus tshawytscha]
MMNRRPNLNGSGGPRSIGVPLLCPSNRVLLEREEVSQAPVMASSFRPSAFPSLHVVPRAPPPDDVRSKRPTAAHRKRRDLQSLVPVQDGCRESPGWFNSSSSQLPAKTNRRRRNKELSFTEVLKNYKLLPDSRPSSPESLYQPETMIPRISVSITRPEGRPSNPRCPTRRPVSPIGLVQPDVQPSRPEGRPSNPQRPTRRPVRPVGLVQPDVQPSRPEGRPSNPRNTSRRKVKPSNPVCPVILESQPTSPVSITTSTVDVVQPEPRPTCPLSLEEPALSESCSFSNNVFVLSMPKAAQPEEAARGSSSPPRDIIRPEAFVQTGPLLARRAQRDAPPPKVPKPPVAPRPKLLPSLGQGNVSLVSANTWDERTKKKRKKGVRVQRSSLGLRHIPVT